MFVVQARATTCNRSDVERCSTGKATWLEAPKLRCNSPFPALLTILLYAQALSLPPLHTAKRIHASTHHLQLKWGGMVQKFILKFCPILALQLRRISTPPALRLGKYLKLVLRNGPRLKMNMPLFQG
jgi:hypothetical protein